MKKIVFLFWFITPFFLILNLWGISLSDFDRVVDFSISLEEMGDALETTDYSLINKDKFVILNGIAAVIQPEKSYFFLLNPEDFTDQSSFINRLGKARDKVSDFLFSQLPQEIQEEIKAYSGSSVPGNDLIRNITNEFKKIFRKMSIFEKERFAGVPLTGELIDLAQRNLATEEMAFVNRLLMEAAYPSEIKKVTVQMEMVYGVWIGYDEVKSYKCIIEFQGPECFKVFKRRDKDDASQDMMIQVNSTVLIIAKILKPFSTQERGKGWLLKGFYVREIL
ncbi:MAG: hypothetical protein JXB88_09170 [Spirochaetales bacterium]|nr:hypothetical protein [Spirochaetales bacterium]